MTTGLTTGPYTLTAGVSLSLSDPYRYSTAAAAVQLQNATGFLLTVQSSGAPYTIQPYTASTIPTIMGGQTLVVLPTAGTPNQVGSLTAVWLLEGQDPPIPDGSLTSGVANQRVALEASDNGSQTYTIPLQATDLSMTLYFTGTWSYLNYSVIGADTAAIYAQGFLAPATLGNQNVGPFAISGAVDTAVNLSISAPSASSWTVTAIISSTPGAFVQQAAGYPLDVVSYGGSKTASVNITSIGTVTLVAAPGAGIATRIHSVSVFGATAGQTVRFGQGSGPFCTLAVGTYPMAFMAEGLLTTGAVTATTTAVTSIFAYVFYDTVTIPYIN